MHICLQNEIVLETITSSGALSQDYFHRYGQDEDKKIDSGEDIDDDELGTGNVQRLTQNLCDLNVEVAEFKVCIQFCQVIFGQPKYTEQLSANPFG